MELLSAATHPDPYPFYAALRARGSMLDHPATGLWLATDANSVAQVLAHPDCLVRPPGEPVPPAIQGTPAGSLFANLMRMNEGTRHVCPRRALSPLLVPFDEASLAVLANAFRDASKTREAAARLHGWMFEFPIIAMASRLGIPRMPSTVLSQLLNDFVACLSPLSSSTQLRASQHAADQLRKCFRHSLHAVAASTTPVYRVGQEHMIDGTVDADVLIDNLIGLLSQTYEATAGLIGNTIVNVASTQRRNGTFECSNPKARDLVMEVLRYDPPVQNTRRFVSRPCEIAGRELPAGSTVLVLLASANRDPTVHDNPDTFSLQRKQGRIFSFGAGRHECPGQELAIAIATQAVTVLLTQLSAEDLHRIHWTYHASINGRIPRFEHP